MEGERWESGRCESVFGLALSGGAASQWALARQSLFHLQAIARERGARKEDKTVSTGKVSRREFLLTTATALVATGLAACASAPAAPQQEAPTEPAKPVAPAKEVTISFMGWGDVEEDEGVRAAVEAFQEENPDVKVTWLHTPDSYQEKMLSMVAAGTPPDTAFIRAQDFQTFAYEGMLLDITDMFQADPVISQPGYFIEPQETQRCTWEGKWYGFGSCWVAPHIYYNGDMFEEAGIEPPSNDPEEAWTWDHFVEVGRQFTVDGAGRHPGDSGFDPDDTKAWGCDFSNYYQYVQAAAEANGGHYFDPETNLLALDSPEAIEGLQKAADLAVVDKVAPFSDVFEQLGMSEAQMLESGKMAMHIEGSWALAWIHKLEVTLGTAVLPKMKMAATSMTAHIHSALSGTKEPEAAYRWLSFLATEFYQLIFLRMGLWLPSQTALMTDEGMAKWYTERRSATEGVHPPGYDQIVKDYVPNYGHVFYWPPGFPEANAILQPALDAIWIGQMTAEEAMKDVVPQCNEILQEAVSSG
jgi:multiple sugar transport system substrate-binding protein